MEYRAIQVGEGFEGTCEWLLENETYVSWAAASSPEGILCIEGKPGSGKSTLLKHTLEGKQKASSASGDDLIFSFFFYGLGVELQKTPLGFFRSLLHQILKQVPTELDDLLAKFKKKRSFYSTPDLQWQENELRSYIVSSLSKISEARSIWLYIDALDECGEDNATILLEWLSDIANLRHCHVCVTCRHYPIMPEVCKFKICPEDENIDDISAYVRGRLSATTRLAMSEIPCLIETRASGVFMWAHFVVEKTLRLHRGGRTLKEIRKEINTIPKELGDLYLKLVVGMEDKPSSLKLMQWICFATRPLTLDELRWAMVVELDDQSCQDCENKPSFVPDNETMKSRVQNLSGGLVEVTFNDERSLIEHHTPPPFHGGVVHFIHQSVGDFLVDKGLSALGGNLQPTYMVLRNAYLLLSKTCIRYLAMRDIHEFTSSGEIDLDNLESHFPFLRYSTTSWVAHTRRVEEYLSQSDLKDDNKDGTGCDFLTLFCWPSNHVVELWTKFNTILGGDPIGFSPPCPEKGVRLVHILARYQILGLLRLVLGEPCPIATDSNHKCGAVVQPPKSYYVEIHAKDANGETPLLYAILGGQKIASQLLLYRGAEIDSASKDGDTPLLRAFFFGYQDIYRFLLDSGANPHLRGRDGSAPLLYAAHYGDISTVRTLLEKGVDVDIQDQALKTPLAIAVGSRREDLVRLLLESKANINTRNRNGWTPLATSILHNEKAMVQLLLNYGAEVNTQDSMGKTPLSWAVYYRNPSIVQLLLNNGANVNSPGKNSSTPLFQAIESGNEAMAQLLLENVAEIPTWKIAGSTPLSWAVTRRYKPLIQLLLNNRAEIDLKDENTSTLLFQAVEGGFEALAQFLVENGAKIRTTDIVGLTPLSWAVMRRCRPVVQSLLESGVEVNSKDGSGWTPLMRASKNNDKAMIKLLRRHGAEWPLSRR